MKKLLCALISCVLMLALHLSHQALVDVSASSPSPSTEDKSLGRKLLKEIGFSAPNSAGNEKAEVIRRTKESEIKVSSLGIEHRYEAEEGLIESADYSIVTTHSPPLPKHHPKP